jgi:hypothetical protein
MELSAWSWVYGAGCLELGAWSWVLGAGCMDLGAWSWVRGAGCAELVGSQGCLAAWLWLKNHSLHSLSGSPYPSHPEGSHPEITPSQHASGQQGPGCLNKTHRPGAARIGCKVLQLASVLMSHSLWELTQLLGLTAKVF